MLYFATRTTARTFATKSNRKVIDLGTTTKENRRWAVKVL